MKKKLLILPLIATLTLSGCGANDHFKDGGHKIGLLKVVYGPIPSMVIDKVTSFNPLAGLGALGAIGGLGELGGLGDFDGSLDDFDSYEEPEEEDTTVYKILPKNIVKVKNDKRTMEDFKNVFDRHKTSISIGEARKTEFGDSFLEKYDIVAIGTSETFKIIEFKNYADLKKAEKEARKVLKKGEGDDFADFTQYFRDMEKDSINGKFLLTPTFGGGEENEEFYRKIFLAVDSKGYEYDNLEKDSKKEDLKLKEVYDFDGKKISVKSIYYSNKIPRFNSELFKTEANQEYLEEHPKYKELREQLLANKPEINISDPDGEINTYTSKEGEQDLVIAMAVSTDEDQVFDILKDFVYLKYGDKIYTPEEIGLYGYRPEISDDFGYLNFELPDDVILDKAELVIKMDKKKLVYKLNKTEVSHITIKED